MRNDNQILHGYQTRCEQTFLQGRPRMLTRDPLAVANFLVYMWCTPEMALRCLIAGFLSTDGLIDWTDVRDLPTLTSLLLYSVVK